MADGWRDAKGVVRQPEEMTNGHLASVLAYLERHAAPYQPEKIYPDRYPALLAEALRRWGRWGDKSQEKKTLLEARAALLDFNDNDKGNSK